jgi:hypothetical protein
MNQLRAIFPDGRFQAPATESEIRSAEEALKLSIPKQLRDLYLCCNGFREDKGNALYLFPLNETDFGDSIISMTRFMWAEFKVPDLKPFLFFGMSSGDEWWGIDYRNVNRIIAYHHHMEDEFEELGPNILDIYRNDYLKCPSE